MSNNKILVKKYHSQIKNNQKNIKNMEKAIRFFGFKNCNTPGNVKRERIRLETQLKEVKADILKAGSRYDTSSVVALKNKEGRILTKLNDLNDILVLLSKINDLKKEIADIEEKIKKLGGKITPVYTEREQMNIVLKALRNNYSREDAAKLADIDLKRIVNWIHEGRNKTNKNKIYFFKQYSKIKSNKNLKIDKLLKHLKNGKSKVEACKLSFVSVKAFDTWYNYGKLGKDKINVNFYNDVKFIQEVNENKFKMIV